MNKPLGFPFGFFTNDNTPIDGKYFNRETGRPYTSMAEAMVLLPVGIRYQGLLINIAGTEYWWPSDASDLNLDPVIKTVDISGKVDKVVGKQLSTEDYTTDEKNKLAGIETGANRYIHPEFHDPSIIAQDANNRFVTDAEKAIWSAKQSALGFTPENIAQKNQANGYAGLDSGAKLPSALFPDALLGNVKYQGVYDVPGNSPVLPAASAAQGHYYIVSAEGTYGGVTYKVGDWIISNGIEWSKVDNSDAVTTVFGRNGNIVANESDYAAYYASLNGYNKANWDTAYGWGNHAGLYLGINGTAYNSDRIGTTPVDFSTYGTAVDWIVGNQGGVLKPFPQSAIRSFLGLGSAAYRDETHFVRNTYDHIGGDFPYSVDTFYDNGGLMTFAYASSGSPTNGVLAAFGSSFSRGEYSFQLQGGYQNNELYFRTRNGDVSSWHSWKRMISSADLGSAAYLNADVNATSGSTVVKRDADGYINAVYYYMSGPGVDSTGTPTDIVTTMGDGYLRRNSASVIRSFLGLGSAFNWSNVGAIDNTVGMLVWKNYGNGHVIFDASAGTSPSGTSVPSSNAQIVWAPSLPSLMGWNGSNTYGLRVDSSRVADSAGYVHWDNIDGKPDVLVNGQSNRTLYDLRINTIYDSDNTAYYLDMNGDSRINRINANHLYAYGWVYSQGDVVAYYSDARLKENIKPITNALDKLGRLNGVTYNANDLSLKLGAAKSKHPEVGVIAQDFQEIMPEVLHLAPFDMDEHGKSKSGENYQTVKYERIVPLLIEAVKELTAKVSELERRLS